MQKPCFWCEDHENRSFLAQSSVGGMAAVCKQLEAAQSFLKQVSQLPNFGALRNKQHESLLLLVKKTKVLNLKDVNSIFQMMDDSTWTPEQIQAVRTAASERLRTEEEDEAQGKRGPKSQDFQNFLGFLKASQWTSLQASGAVSSGCSKLASMLGHLGLRHPSEWTFGTMYCFMHLVLALEVPDASTAYAEISKLKPAIRKQLEGLPEPTLYLLQLPKTPAELPRLLFEEVYGSEEACEAKISKELLIFTTSQISVRKSGDKVLDHKAPQVPVDPMQAMASTATALMTSILAGQQAGATSVAASAASGSAAPPLARMPSRPILALCDGPAETPAEADPAPAEPVTVQEALVPLAASQLPEQLDKLKTELERGHGNTKPQKRPAAAEAFVSEEDCRGSGSLAQGKAKGKSRPKAKPVLKAKPAAADSAVLKRPAASSTARSIKEVPGLTWQDRIRMRPNGCSKCRQKRGCTLSCFATYLKQQSSC